MSSRPVRSHRMRPVGQLAAAAIAVALGALVGLGRAAESTAPAGTLFYSTANPPVELQGPTPRLILLARADMAPADATAGRADAVPSPEKRPAEPARPKADAKLEPAGPEPERKTAAELKEAAEAERLASSSGAVNHPKPPSPPAPASAAESLAHASAAATDPVVVAKRMMAECRARYEQVHDYTCTFYKRERIDGRLQGQHTMHMKFKTKPASVYFKFVKPNAGREAIYVAGRNGGRAIVHDVGLGKLIAGTLALDPRGSRAMEDCRHPITEAGIGHMIDSLVKGWDAEMRTGETQVTIQPGVHVGQRVCTLIESAHPQKRPGFVFHKVRVFVDQEHGLPVRFEAYDWPRRPGQSAELLEEYTYANLRLNVGLRDSDFDPENAQYSFGRF